MFENRPKPSLQDWLLLVISIVFVAAGFLMLPSNRDAGIVTIAFFGTCLATFLMQVIGKLRRRASTIETAHVAGGVPIKPSRLFAYGFALWMLALGVIMFVFGGSYPDLFRWIAAFVALVGAAMLFGAVTGKFPGVYLQFDPDALTIAQRGWRTRIPWDRIADIGEGELQGNPVLYLIVENVHDLPIDPPSAREKAMKQIGRNIGWHGAPFIIMSTHYAISLPVLSAAIATYVRDPAERATLVRAIAR